MAGRRETFMKGRDGADNVPVSDDLVSARVLTVNEASGSLVKISLRGCGGDSTIAPRCPDRQQLSVRTDARVVDRVRLESV